MMHSLVNKDIGGASEIYPNHRIATNLEAKSKYDALIPRTKTENNASVGIRNRFVIDNTLPFFYSFSVCENIVYMERCKIRGDRNFRIDRRGYDTDDPLVREERVDVSPAGTEGIFIDTDSPDSNAEDG